MIVSLNHGVSVIAIAIAVLSAPLALCADQPVEEIVVWGSDRDRTFGHSSPTSTLTPSDFASINVATTEDVVKFEPSVVIRRRFIGDSNGVMGMRGSNMFQTSRSMVFADGVPLHYLLQSRWNGAPRWAMVSASEIAKVDIHYGPFSAEYGGNSMGGSIALRYALDHPNKITGLVLINSSGFMRKRIQNDDSQGVLAFRLLKNPWFRAIGEVMDPYYFVSQGLEAAFHQQAVVTEAMVMRYYDLALREGTRKATMKRFSATEDKKYQAQDLARINVPTLLMWGKEDAVAPFAFASGYETLIPDISTAYYDGVGHIPMEEVPEISAADLIAFMGKINGKDK